MVFNPEAKSTDASSEIRSRSLRKSQSPSGKPDRANHRSGSPHSRSPSSDRRDWLKERLAAYDSTSTGRSGHSSHKSQSPDSGSRPGEGKEKNSQDQSHVSENRHRSVSSHRSGSREKHFYYKRTDSSDRKSHNRRSSSYHRSQSPVKSRSERHSGKKRYSSPRSEERQSRRDYSPHSEKKHSFYYKSHCGSRSKSDRYSDEKHHRSSERMCSPSQSHSKSRHDRRSSSDHHSPSSERKNSVMHHRSCSQSKSRSLERSPRTSQGRSSTKKRKHSPSEQKTQSKSKCEKESKLKQKSSNHRSSSSSKKSKQHYKKSKSSNKTKSGKHKDKSSHHRSKKYQSHHSSLSTERYWSDSVSLSSTEEKYQRYRSYSPSGKLTHTRYRSESPRNRSMSPESYVYQQKRLPQYGSQEMYGRSAFSPYMQQLAGLRYPNYPNYNNNNNNNNNNNKRAGWNFQQNFSARNNQQRWMTNNNNSNYNNNRNRNGFYRRQGWSNSMQNNRMRNNMNMFGYQRGRYQLQINHTNTNYQNRGQQQRRWQQQTQSPFTQTRRPQPRPYSLASWDNMSADSPYKSQQRSSVSMSPSPKRKKKALSSSASPHRSPPPAPKAAQTLVGSRPNQLPLGYQCSASESSVKKASPHSSPSPVELQNLRVVVDNVPVAPDIEDSATMSDHSESQTPEPESPRPCKEPVFVESSSEEEEEEEQLSSDLSPSRKNALRRSRFMKKGMIIAPKLPAKNCLSQSAKVPSESVKDCARWSSDSKDEDVADRAVSDSSDEEELHSMSGGSEESITEVDHNEMPEDSEVELEIISNSDNSSEEHDTQMVYQYKTDNLEQTEVHSVADSSEEERAQTAPQRKQVNQKSIRAMSSHCISPSGIKARLPDRTQKLKSKTPSSKIDPTIKAEASGYISPGEMISSAIRAHLLAKNRQSKKAKKQATQNSSRSEEEEYWPANVMKVKKQNSSHQCTCSCSSRHENNLLSLPVKNQLNHAWTQTDLTGDFKIEGEQDIDNINKKKRKLKQGRFGLSNYDSQSLRRQPRKTQTGIRSKNRFWKLEPNFASHNRKNIENISSSSTSDSETPPPTTKRQAKKAKRPVSCTSNSKITEKMSPGHGRHTEKTLQEALNKESQREKSPQEQLPPPSCPNFKVSPQSSIKQYTKKAQKHSHPPLHLKTLADKLSDKEQEVKKKIPLECDAASMIIDISSVPLPSESAPPRKAAAGITSSGSSDTGIQQTLAGGAESSANGPQKSSSIGDSLLITSQNRIYKKAWQSTVTSDSAKKGDINAASYQSKTPACAVSQPCTPQKELVQANLPGASSPKPSEKSLQQDRQSESSAVQSNMVTAKEAKVDSGMTATPDSPNKKQISVKLSSTAKPLILTKKVSLSSNSSEDDAKSQSLGRRKKTATLNKYPITGRKLDTGRPESKEGKDEICQQENVLKPSMDRARTSQEKAMSSERVLKTSTQARLSRSPNTKRRRSGICKAVPHDGGDEGCEQESVHEPVIDQSKTKEGQDMHSKTSVRMPIKLSRHSGPTGRLESHRLDPKKTENIIHQQMNVLELETDEMGTEEEIDINNRKRVRTRIPSSQSRSSSASNRIFSSRPQLQEGGIEILEHQIAGKLKMNMSMAKDGTKIRGEKVVKKRIPKKQSRCGNNPAHHNLMLDERKEDMNKHQNIHERVLSKPLTQEGQLLRKMAAKSSMSGKHGAYNLCRLKMEDKKHMQRQPIMHKVNLQESGSRQERVIRKRMAVKDSLQIKHPTGLASRGNIETGTHRPKRMVDEAQGYPNIHDLPIEKKRLRTETHIKHRTPGICSPAISTSTAPQSCRLQQHKKRELSEDQGYPDVMEIKVEKEEEEQENRTAAAVRDIFVSDSEASSSGGSTSEDSSNELERRLREKLLRSLQAKRPESSEDSPRASRADSQLSAAGP